MGDDTLPPTPDSLPLEGGDQVGDFGERGQFGGAQVDDDIGVAFTTEELDFFVVDKADEMALRAVNLSLGINAGVHARMRVGESRKHGWSSPVGVISTISSGEEYNRCVISLLYGTPTENARLPQKYFRLVLRRDSLLSLTLCYRKCVPGGREQKGACSVDEAKVAETDPELMVVVREDYGLREPVEVRLLRDVQAGNKTYLVTSEAGKQILRVYGACWESRADWIDFELELLLHLRDHGVPVSTPLLRGDGQMLGEVRTAEGKRYSALFTYAEGTMEWPMSEPKSRNFGAALARLHLAANDFSLDRPYREYDLARLVEQPMARMLPYIADRADDVRYLERLGEQIMERVRQIERTPDTYGVLHGDIHQGNCHFTPEGAPTLFDFSLCGVGWRTYDFTGFLWPMRDETIKEAAYRQSCEAFLAGYRSVRELTPAEETAIPAFVKVRDLWEHGEWLAGDPNLEAAKAAPCIISLLEQFRATPL